MSQAEWQTVLIRLISSMQTPRGTRADEGGFLELLLLSAPSFGLQTQHAFKPVTSSDR